MYVRYLIESVMFVLLAFTFQYIITIFNKDTHLIREDKDHLANLDKKDFASEEEFQKAYDKLEEHLHHDLLLAAVYLAEAMEVAFIVFSFPIRTIMVAVFSYRTGRNFKLLNFNTVVDTCLFIGVLAWFIKYEQLMHEPVDKKHSFNHHETMMWNLIEDIEDSGFRFDILLSFVSGMFWLKVFFLLKLTRTFGPMVKIIIAMLADIISFCVIWCVQLFFFTCVGILIFG